jgi:hypothetical protein
MGATIASLPRTVVDYIAGVDKFITRRYGPNPRLGEGAPRITIARGTSTRDQAQTHEFSAGGSGGYRPESGHRDG